MLAKAREGKVFLIFNLTAPFKPDFNNKSVWILEFKYNDNLAPSISRKSGEKIP